MTRAALALCISLSLIAAAASADEPAKPAAEAPYFETLGTWHRAITTTSPEAQKWFDQGLRLMYAFNLEEAQRSFEEAAGKDPSCASCHWGIAFSLGPHINLPALPERTKAAYAAIAKAQALSKDATPVEQALIAAMTRRYADPPPADPAAQIAVNEEYANAMRDVHKRFPDDVDVAAVFVESLMDLRPWDLWTADGKPQPGTEEIVSTLEWILQKAPDHPGANHYYIHAVEASPHPEKAMASAQRLPGLMPGAGHIVHMPAHVFMRTGRYEDAAEANRRAIKAEDVYVRRVQPAGFYTMYVAHNHQFLMATAMMQGRAKEAIESAREALVAMPVEMLRQMPGFDFALEYPTYTLSRFGRWAEVLAEQAPPADFPVAVALHKVARGIALAETGKVAQAAELQKPVFAALLAVPETAAEGNNPARSVLGVGAKMLAGVVAFRQGHADAGLKALAEAVALEDGLRYNEPSDWYFPVRHTLGALLLEAKKPAEAQAVYEADLARNPDNGWGLLGLEQALRAQKKAVEADQAHARFMAAWKNADVAAKSSRF